MKKRPTIVDIAKAAGVTDGTVSRALANDPRVRAETRARILEAAKRMNYRPHLSARFFKQGITKNIGVYSESGAWIFFHHYHGRLLAGLAEAAQLEGEHLVFYLPPCEEAPVRSTLVKLEGLDAVLDGRVDGAVVLGGDRIPAADRQKLSESGLPVVFLSNNLEISGAFQILSGAYERTRAAADHLYSMGHRRIGLTGYYQDAHYMQASIKGLRDFHESCRLPFDPRCIDPPTSEKAFDPEDLKGRMSRLKGAGVTGLITTEIAEAVMAVRLLETQGVNVPRDMSVVSFGPMLWGASDQRPRLTILDTDLKEYGFKCHRMFKDARDRHEPRKEAMEWTLAPGGETLAPPRS